MSKVCFITSLENRHSTTKLLARLVHAGLEPATLAFQCILYRTNL
jgi:hypothetical protein